jgi:hypothetical protein
MQIPPERAQMMSALFEMLFDAGNFIVALSVDGAVMAYRVMVF